MFDRIIDAIKDEISRLSISEAEMARRLNVPQSSLHRILAGNRGLGVNLLERILSARPDWYELLNGGGPGSPSNSH